MPLKDEPEGLPDEGGNLGAGAEDGREKERKETEGARGHNARKRRGCFAGYHPSDVLELLLYY